MTEKVSARTELEEVAALYRDADFQEKGAKAVKEYLRSAFMDLITEVVEEEIPLATKKVKIPACSDEEGEAWRLRNFPSWRVVFIEAPDKDGMVEVTLEEDPALLKFEFEVDGYKFGRTVDSGTPGFDVDRFYSENPELRDVVDEITSYTLNATKAKKLLSDRPEMQIVFEQYTIPGVPKSKVLPIREVKEIE